METKILWTRKAETNLLDIRNHSLEHFEYDITKDIVKSVDILLKYPEIGIQLQFDETVRLLRHKKWNIYYKIRTDKIVIYAILGQMQNEGT